jgi:amino acid transporter
MQSDKKLFVRESSGLIRDISAKDAFSMNFAYLGPAAGVAYPLSFAVALLGSNWVLAVALGAILMFPVALLYYKLASIMPRSAGDYIYISRVLGPRMGFIQAISNIFVFGSGVPLLAQLELPLVLQPSLEALGVAFHDSALISFANNFSFSNEASPIFFGFTLLIIGIATLVSALRTKYFALTVTILTFLQIIGTIAMIIGIFIIPNYASAFNSVSLSYGGPTYSSLVEGLAPFSVLQTLVLMAAINSFLFLYNNAPTFFGGEVKRGKNTMLIGLIISYITTAIMSILLVAALQYKIGTGFYDYTTVNGWLNSNGNGIPIVPTSLIAYLVIPFLNDPILVLIMVISAITWYLLYAIINVAIPSRTLFALSFDWMAPTFFSKINDKLRSPLYSVLFVGGIAVIFDVLEIYLGFSEGVLVDIIIFMIYQYVPAAISAIVMVVKKMYGVNDTSLVVIGGISVFSLLLSAILLITYGLFNSSFGSMIFSGNTILNLGLIVGVPLAALGLFEGIRYYRLKQGIDVTLTFKEIPPE